MSEQGGMPGVPILRNPGVTLIWVTRQYNLFRDGRGQALIRVGEPDAIEWWSEGRAATRAEIEHSIETGLPSLEALAGSTSDLALLRSAVAQLRELMPER